MSAQPATFTYDPAHSVQFDVYVPSDLTSSEGEIKSLPLIINWHGGGMVAGGKKDLFFPQYLVDKFNAKGVIYISANHRLLYPSSTADIIEDVHTLFQYISSGSSEFASYLHGIGIRVDTTKIGVSGISGGVYSARAASTLATVLPRPKVSLSLYGMAGNFLLDFWVKPNDPNDYYKALALDHDKLEKLVIENGGAVVSDAPLKIDMQKRQATDEFNRVGFFVDWQHKGILLDYILNEHGLSSKINQFPLIERINHIPENKKHLLLPLDKDTVPTFFIHGTKDLVVPIEESHAAYEELRQLGVQVGKAWVEGADHGLLDPSKPPNRIQGWEEAVDSGINFVIEQFDI
ncbi:uncharacterized protein IL334_005516 [Kwoniella shivajii]|uniref:Peptidase S9 prolyl oligopeptidase catalytic domain-containing protein n=1 Tax=Kwoniella shivajii TaxID=564305 RepID=A0ABZ1D5F1_9TREE|nr:hypothetical protein IL334_005516 [Kwoniella shivajii]